MPAERHTTSSPKPWKQFEARTTFVRVPADDWAQVRIGAKTEFRATGRAITQLWNVTLPMAVVIYAERRGQYAKLMAVLEETWKEPLGGISPDSLKNEGFETMAEFRRYWMERTHRRFRPMLMVQAYRIRLWQDEDAANLGLKLIHKLYQEHL